MFVWDCYSLCFSLSLWLPKMSSTPTSTLIHCTILLLTYTYREFKLTNVVIHVLTWLRERERKRGEREGGRKNGGSLELSITCARLGGIRDMCTALDTSCNQAGRIIFTSFPWCEEWDLSEMITLIPRRPAGRVAWSGSGSTFPRHCCVNDHCTTDRIMMCL